MVATSSPSMLLKAGDVIAVSEGSKTNEKIKAIIEANSARPVPKWLDSDRNTMTGRYVELPKREDIDLEIAEHLIVELYSK